jgi:hypothetical protein
MGTPLSGDIFFQLTNVMQKAPASHKVFIHTAYFICQSARQSATQTECAVNRLPLGMVQPHTSRID